MPSIRTYYAYFRAGTDFFNPECPRAEYHAKSLLGNPLIPDMNSQLVFIPTTIRMECELGIADDSERLLFIQQLPDFAGCRDFREIIGPFRLVVLGHCRKFGEFLLHVESEYMRLKRKNRFAVVSPGEPYSSSKRSFEAMASILLMALSTGDDWA